MPHLLVSLHGIRHYTFDGGWVRENKHICEVCTSTLWSKHLSLLQVLGRSGFVESLDRIVRVARSQYLGMADSSHVYCVLVHVCAHIVVRGTRGTLYGSVAVPPNPPFWYFWTHGLREAFSPASLASESIWDQALYI